MAMAQVQVLHDVLQCGIRWRVTLHAFPDQGSLVRFEESGGGGRLLNLQFAHWNPLAATAARRRTQSSWRRIAKLQ
jgi:hypothetical protein